MYDKYKTLAKLALIFFILPGICDCGKLRAKRLGISPPVYNVRVEKNVMVPMRDGKRMATDIYFPKGISRAPVILIRTPYGKNMQMVMGRNNTARLFARRGYIVAIQDVRGRYKSEGQFYPFTNDGSDGQDMIAWIEDQPWFNGRLGTYGGSYLGTTQWFASPGMDIDAMYLQVTSPDLDEVTYTGGELHLMTVYLWAMVMGERRNDFNAAFKIRKINKSIYTLPLSDADDKAGRDVDYFNHSLDPSGIMKTYEGINFEDKYDDVSAPSVFIAGWYDMFLGPQLKDYTRLVNEGSGRARDSVLVVGPWGHGMKGGDGSVDYGPDSDMKGSVGPAHFLDWFDYRLRDMETEAADWPRVRIFVMGDNVWRDEKEWPLSRTEYTKYYLHSFGNANTRSGDGVLSVDPDFSGETPDRFVYDPLDPVPTRGGNSLGINLGAYDQSEIEDRQDVLCYTSAVLDTDLEVTGTISAVLYAASDARDTDFTVKLVDVYPDGKAVNIQDGVVRAVFRDNDPYNPSPLTPGAAEKYVIDMWATSNVFKAGHRIRVEVSSSNFPRFNRNLNTGEPVSEAVNSVTAKQTVFHDKDHPSYILLPVIPR